MTDADKPELRIAPRLPRSAAPLEALAQPPGFGTVRLGPRPDGAAAMAWGEDLRALRRSRADRGLDILALSGGGSGGAFGAGVLCGWSQSGRRPQFDIVTGVSTGALMAPFAFLGSAWDDRLVDAYTGGHAAELLSLRAVYKGDGLEQLVDPFATEALVEAVAAEHRKGRRLYVSTTDLDAQQGLVWDLGAIAAHGGPAAVGLFRDVLVASASFPGVFRPKMIEVEWAGPRYQEMHVDGGAATPLFILPRTGREDPSLAAVLAGARVHAIINTGLAPRAEITPMNRLSVLVRSFDTMLHLSYCQAVETATALCAGQGASLKIATPAGSLSGAGLINFSTSEMVRQFHDARETALDGRVWSAVA